MKKISILLISVILFSCSTELKRYPFEDTISKNQLVYLENDMSLVNGIVYLKIFNNTLNKEITYIDGEKEGLESSWYINGQLFFEGNYIDGKKDGEHKFLEENGDLSWKTNYKEGKKDGLDKDYLEGELFTSTEYKNGKMDGLYKQYYKGELLFTIKYKDGERID